MCGVWCVVWVCGVWCGVQWYHVGHVMYANLISFLHARFWAWTLLWWHSKRSTLRNTAPPTAIEKSEHTHGHTGTSTFHTYSHIFTHISAHISTHIWFAHLRTWTHNYFVHPHIHTQLFHTRHVFTRTFAPAHSNNVLIMHTHSHTHSHIHINTHIQHTHTFNIHTLPSVLWGIAPQF